MKTLRLAVAAGLLIGSSGLGFAQSSQNSTPNNTPGHEMQRKGSVKGEPGASGYSPGHRMQEGKSTKDDPGASGNAPGQRNR
jgi:hypothetical protein